MKSVKQVSIHEYILTQRYKSFFASKIICSKTGLFFSFIKNTQNKLIEIFQGIPNI